MVYWGCCHCSKSGKRGCSDEGTLPNLSDGFIEESKQELFEEGGRLPLSLDCSETAFVSYEILASLRSLRFERILSALFPEIIPFAASRGK